MKVTQMPPVHQRTWWQFFVLSHTLFQKLDDVAESVNDSADASPWKNIIHNHWYFPNQSDVPSSL